MVYTQQKFNLLREEGEGFAKLLAALHRCGAAALSPASAPGLVRHVAMSHVCVSCSRKPKVCTYVVQQHSSVRWWRLHSKLSAPN